MSRPESLPSSDELLARLESQRLLADAVAKLREPYRSSILLRYYEGLTAVEIAERQGVPDGTVRVRLKRAHELLRESLDRSHDGDRGAWVAALIPLADSARSSAGRPPCSEGC